MLEEVVGHPVTLGGSGHLRIRVRGRIPVADPAPVQHRHRGPGRQPRQEHGHPRVDLEDLEAVVRLSTSHGASPGASDLAREARLSAARGPRPGGPWSSRSLPTQ